jgi:predicted phosphoribosyltransferase
MPFKDRTDAGRQLVRALTAYHDGTRSCLHCRAAG